MANRLASTGGIVFVDPAALSVGAGAVDQMGDRPQRALGLLEQPHDVGFARHVAGQGDGLATLGLYVGDHGFGLGVAGPIVDGNAVAACRGLAGGLGADARGAAGDQEDFVHGAMI